MNLRLLALTLLVLLTSICSADEKSGPGRTTIATFDGGTVYYVNNLVTGKRTKRAQWTLQTKKGPIVVSKSPWGFLIKGAKVDVKLEAGMSELSVRDEKKKVTVKSEFGGKTIVKFGDDEVTFQEVGLNGVSASGSRGTLNVEKEIPKIKVSSRSGTTMFSRKFDGYVADGVPLRRHPYTFRALLFERNGVGIMLDLLPYHHDSMKSILDWSRVRKL